MSESGAVFVLSLTSLRSGTVPLDAVRVRSAADAVSGKRHDQQTVKLLVSIKTDNIMNVYRLAIFLGASGRSYLLK